MGPKSKKKIVSKDITKQFNADSRLELTQGYRIIEAIMAHPSSTDFINKPEFLKGMTDYNEIIKNPMWLEEVNRKFTEGVYQNLFEAVKDIRLIFENCYYFWGIRNNYTECALEIEHIFEKKLSLLPKDIQSKCSLEATHGPWSNELLEKQYKRSCRFHKKKGEYCSNLVLRAWERMRNKEKEDFDRLYNLFKTTQHGASIIDWENKSLCLPEYLNTIYSMWELPQIGQFLYLTKDVLNLSTYSQLEIERMFLVPQSSLAIAEIATALLSSTYAVKTDSTTPLPYEEWSLKLHSTVSRWYLIHNSNKEENVEEVSNVANIQPCFFKLIGEENPLQCTPFHKIPYEKRVQIFLALCSYKLLKQKEQLHECFVNNPSELCPRRLGKDKNGNTYIYFQKFVDLRIYSLGSKKESTTHDVDDSTMDDDDDDDDSYDLLAEYPPWEQLILNNIETKVIADSIEGLRQLIEDLIKSDIMDESTECSISNNGIVDDLQEFETYIQSRTDDVIGANNAARVKMYRESFSHGYVHKSRWSNEPSTTDSSGCENSTNNDQTEKKDCDFPNINTRTRNIKCHRNQKFKLSDDSNDSEEEDTSDTGSYLEEEDSDEDWNASLKKKGKKRKATTKFKKQVKTLKIKLAEQEKQEKTKKTSSKSLDKNVKIKKRSINIRSLSANGDNRSDTSLASTSSKGESSKSFSDTEIQKAEKRNNKLSDKLLNAQTSPDVTKFKPIIAKTEIIDTENNCTVVNHPTTVKETATILESKIVGSKENEKTEIKSAEKIVNVSKCEISTPNIKIKSEVNVKNEIIIDDDDEPDVTIVSVITPDKNKIGSSHSTISPRLQNTPLGNSRFSYPVTNHGSPVTRTVNPPTLANRQVQLSNKPMPRFSNNNLSVTTSRLRLPTSVSPQRIRSPGGYTLSPRQITPRQITPIKHTTPSYSPPSRQVPKTPINRITPENVSARSATSFHTFGQSVTITPTKNPPRPVQRKLFKTEVEGLITLKYSQGNSFYVVKLANGNTIPLTNQQVQNLRQGNNGVLPQSIKIPVSSEVADRIEPCFLIED